jgi:putative MATE family efflux protein
MKRVCDPHPAGLTRASDLRGGAHLASPSGDGLPGAHVAGAVTRPTAAPRAPAPQPAPPHGKAPAAAGVRLTERPLRAAIWALAGPALVELSLVTLVQMIGLMMVGRLGPTAIDAVGLTNQPVFFAQSIFVALDVGTTALVAHAIGAGDRELADAAALQTFVLNVALGVVLSGLCAILARPVLVFMGAGPATLAVGVPYFRIIGAALAFNTLALSLTAILRGAGDTLTPMRINIAANVVLVLVGTPLIYGLAGLPRLGVTGAGIGTVCAYVTACGLALRAVFSGRCPVRVSFRRGYRFDAALVRRIVRVGLPSAGEQAAMRGGVLLFMRVVAGLGTVTFAAHQIAGNVWSLSFMPGQAFSIAATTLVGQHMGAGRPDLAERAGAATNRIAFLAACAVGVLFVLGRRWIFSLYTPDPQVADEGQVALLILGLMQPLQSLQFALAGGLRGAGDTRWPLLATFVGVWVFRLCLGYLFVDGLGWGLAGAWLAIAADQSCRSAFVVWRWKSGRWKLARV